MLLRFLSVPFSRHFRSLLPLALVCALSSLGLCARSQTNVTVNTPTEAALDAAFAQVAQGGTITFACDGTIPITHTKTISAGNYAGGDVTVTLDATGHNITFDGGGKGTLFAGNGGSYSNGSPNSSFMYTAVTFIFKHLTLINSADSAVNTGVNGQVVATNCVFSGNKTTQYGGAIYATPGFPINNGAIATLTRCTFVNNQAGLGSGAVAGNVSAVNCTFLNNVAGKDGGAIGSPLGLAYGILMGCVFVGNAVNGAAGTSANPVSSSGGAVQIGIRGAVTNCTFLNNHVAVGAYASANGGALFLPDLGTVINCTFVGNSVTAANNSVAQGGALYCATQTSYACTLTNCTFAGNNATSIQGGSAKGGGVCNSMGNLTLTNTIVANNTASTSGNNVIGIITDGGHNLSSDASCAFASTSSSKNNTDPRLGSLVYTGGATPTLSLLAGSPAINAGDDMAAPTTDQRGAARQGAHSDIGAYERAVWQAQALAVGPDGNTRVLWNKSDGSIQVWNVNTMTGSVLTRYAYGPFAGWTATGLSVGADNKPRLLWSNPQGQIGLWNIDETNGSSVYTSAYGPCTPWNAQGIAVGSDNLARVLWTTPAGYLSLWNVNVAANAAQYGAAYGPCAPWNAQALALDSDNRASVLWTAPGGLMSLWRLDSLSAAPRYSRAYPTDASWTATALSVGGDKRARVLWNRIDGLAGVWSVDISADAVDTGVAYTPPAGAAYTALSTGSDNNTRLLASQLDGTLLLSVVDTHTGAVLASYTFPTP